MTGGKRVILKDRVSENTVHGSTVLTTNGVGFLELEYLSVRPERRRRAPTQFSHSQDLSDGTIIRREK